MVAELRVDVNSVVNELNMALSVLTEAKVMSRYRRLFKGRGLDFEDFRNYTTNDDASEIDWKASKRANQLVIRQYKEERDMKVFFLVDVSNSMLFGSTKKLKHEYAAELVAALAHFVLESGDKIGMIMFTDKVVKFVDCAKGRTHYYALLKRLLTPGMYGGGYNITNALKFLSNTVREKCLVFIVSDFIGMERGWDTALKNVSGKFDGVAIKIRDPRDQVLPPEAGQVVVSDPYSDRELLVDCGDDARNIYESYVQRMDDEIKTILRESVWDLLEVTTDEDFVLPIIRFLKRREILSR